VIAIAIAFLSLILLGYTSDARLSQIPAAASITVFFAIVIAVAGAITLFLRTWAIPVLVIVVPRVEYCIKKRSLIRGIKHMDLNYINKTNARSMTGKPSAHWQRTAISNADKKYFIRDIEPWKAKQKTDKPILYIINTSGGGARSAVFYDEYAAKFG
jgi:hypothetical protein